MPGFAGLIWPNIGDNDNTLHLKKTPSGMRLTGPRRGNYLRLSPQRACGAAKRQSEHYRTASFPSLPDRSIHGRRCKAENQSFGGSNLAARSGHSVSITSRISSLIAVTLLNPSSWARMSCPGRPPKESGCQVAAGADTPVAALCNWAGAGADCRR